VIDLVELIKEKSMQLKKRRMKGMPAAKFLYEKTG